MSKICIVGNSHLGALAQSDAGNGRFKDASYDLVYWGAAGTLFPKVRYQAGRLISPHPERSLLISGGRYDHLKIDDFDTLVFYACHVVIFTEAKRQALAISKDAPRSSSFIDAVIDENIKNWWDGHFARKMIEAVRAKHPEIKYIFAPHPLIAKNAKSLSGLKDLTQFKEIIGKINVYLEGWCQDNTIIYCPQNPKTIDENEVSTLVQYTGGSVKMEAGEAHPDDDFTHMNAAYGDIALQDLASILSLGEQQ